MIDVDDKIIGPGQPCFIIAEAGVNHNGNLETAHKLIDAAVDAGANAIKFQTFVAEETVSFDTPLAGHHVENLGQSISHFELIKKLELPHSSFKKLKEHCEKKRVIFISTPYDILSAELLINIGTKIIKIASSEITNYPLLHTVGKSKIPVILSTGMSNWEEIVESIEFIESYHPNIIILKCTSNYPASHESINLNGILKLKNTFPKYPVGFSDHTEGNEASLTSLGLNISVIERHFTLDKNEWGPDHKSSMTPKEFERFVCAVRKSEKALGAFDWNIQAEEIPQFQTMRKGVYTRRPICKGENVTLKDVKFLRPLGKLSPKDFYLNYLGKVVIKDIASNQIILPDYFLK